MKIAVFSTRARNGLTLIELLAALTMSAMIMAVLMGLVVRLSLARDTLKKEKPFEGWQTILNQQLQDDYVGCRSILVSSKQILMEGYSNVETADGQSKNGPSRVRYSIVSNEDGNWLYREQTNLLALPGDDRTKSLVCKDVLSFRALNELSTDVAPGVLLLDLVRSGRPEDINIGNKNSALRVTLVRHGGIQ